MIKKLHCKLFVFILLYVNNPFLHAATVFFFSHRYCMMKMKTWNRNGMRLL